MRWTGGRRSGPESPANGGVPPQAGARRAPATVEVPPPADDISSAAHSRVAQLVEQPAVNRRVAGSSPASGASQLSAPQSLSDSPFGPSGAGDGLVTVSGSLSGVGTAHARSSMRLSAAHAFPLRHEEQPERPTVPGERVGELGVGRLAVLEL